jgi:hypothetical protein
VQNTKLNLKRLKKRFLGSLWYIDISYWHKTVTEITIENTENHDHFK